MAVAPDTAVGSGISIEDVKMTTVIRMSDLPPEGKNHWVVLIGYQGLLAGNW
jgi:hypothetical protein